MLKKIPITFHSGSNYDYHFIIKGPTEEFKKQFPCLGENLKIHNLYISRKKEVTRN